MHARFLLGIATVLLSTSVASRGTAFAQASQVTLSDATLTADLLSEPGPTFRVSTKKLRRHWTLIAYGDMRFTDPANHDATSPEMRRLLIKQIAGENPDALLLSGDIPFDGAEPRDYQVFATETAAWRDKKLRVYPAVGNHELFGSETREPNNWWGAFPELKGRRWYSVQFGDAYLLTLDSNLSLDKDSRQGNWLRSQLDHLPKRTKVVFVSMHHPPVADSIENDDSHNVRTNELQISPLVEKKAAATRVKFVVVAGHIHNYQRFLQNGVVYLVSGGGGAKPARIARTPADLFRGTSFPNYHYIKFAYDGKQLNATMYRVRNPENPVSDFEMNDTFTISSGKSK